MDHRVDDDRSRCCVDRTAPSIGRQVLGSPVAAGGQSTSQLASRPGKVEMTASRCRYSGPQTIVRYPTLGASKWKTGIWLNCAAATMTAQKAGAQCLCCIARTGAAFVSDSVCLVLLGRLDRTRRPTGCRHTASDEPINVRFDDEVFMKAAEATPSPERKTLLPETGRQLPRGRSGLS